MDFKKIREEDGAIKRRERLYILIAVVLSCIVLAQCVTIAVQHGMNSRYQSMYNEALKTKLDMQKAINDMQSAENDTPDSVTTER